jgi:hypothetical protein
MTVAQVMALIPVEGTISATLLGSYLDIVQTELDLALENIFADPAIVITEDECINYSTQNTNGSNFISIRAWQPTDLVLKQTTIDNQNKVSLDEQPLVLGEDYVLWYGFQGNKIPGLTVPVTAIKLLNARLSPAGIIRVYGTYGWQAGYPVDVQNMVANMVVNLAGFAISLAELGGASGAKRIKSMTTEIELSDDMSEKLRNYARSFMDDPAYIAILDKYRYATKETITII